MKMVRNSDFQAKSPLSVICELNESTKTKRVLDVLHGSYTETK
jgi:hypothetical protein